MRDIDMIVVHCSGSRCDHRYTMKMLRYDHVHNNGWTDIGYHFYITLDGVVHACRPVERMGSHAIGYNAHSIGICYEGGLSPSGCISDTRTPEQKESMKHLIQELHHRFPGIRTILGHRDLPGVQKACPCFDATKLQYLLDASWEELRKPAGFKEECRQDEEGQLIISGSLGEKQKAFLMAMTDMKSILVTGHDYQHSSLLVPAGTFSQKSAFGSLKATVDTSLMLLYAMRSAAGDTLLFHSSTVVKDGKAYLFLGKSGTGKSTHSGLWLKHIEGTRLLNDDNPVVYISHEGTPMVSGSPWSGKTPCYKNEEYPIGAIVQLRQAPENKIRKQTVIESYVSIKTSVSGKAWEKEIADGQHQTIEKLIGATRLYQLDCLPDAGAALLCSQTISL